MARCQKAKVCPKGFSVKTILSARSGIHFVDVDVDVGGFVSVVVVFRLGFPCEPTEHGPHETGVAEHECLTNTYGAKDGQGA